MFPNIDSFHVWGKEAKKSFKLHFPDVLILLLQDYSE